ncbi:MAG TPA: hypothetical protein VMV81_06655 [Phycisphaerae bacterium]|nr:hypothetical protein [Phycisphaerae bacterium]
MRKRSTTIIEVVAAMAILSVALPPLISAFAESSRQTIFPSNSAVASFLAIERMEEIMARRYRGTDGYTAITAASFPNESAVDGFPMFSRTVSIAYVTSTLAPSANDQGYKKVTVTVAWNSGAQTLGMEHVFAQF